MGVIYKITSPTGRQYIGKTYDLRKRINCHKSATKKGSNIILHNSIRKYGWDKHKLEIVEEVEDSFLNEREIFWIGELKTYVYENTNGLNMTKGGEGQRSTWMHRIDLREKQSIRYTGEGNPFYGKTHSEENRNAQSQRAKKYNLEHQIKVPLWGAEKGWAKVRKEIIAYNNNGSLIGEYPSLTICAQQLNINIQGIKDSLKYNQWHLGQYIFKYKTDRYESTIEVGDIKIKNEKRPIVLMSENFDVIAEYSSAKEASKFWGIPKTTINRAAMYNWGVPIRTGHSFIYKDLYKELMQEVA